MNLLLFAASELRDSILELADRRAQHIIRVLKLRPGDRLRLGMLDGPRGTGTLLDLSATRVRLQVELEKETPPVPDIILVLALPRPIMLRRILKQASVLGVDRIHLINSRRVEKSFFRASILQPEKIRALLIEGASQAMDTRLPQVIIHPLFKPFIEDVASKLRARHRLLAHPGERRGTPVPLANRTGEKTVLAVGPEGGWIDYERDRFRELGFLPFSLGPRILHVDTAVIALISRVQLLLELGAGKT